MAKEASAYPIYVEITIAVRLREIQSVGVLAEQLYNLAKDSGYKPELKGSRFHEMPRGSLK